MLSIIIFVSCVLWSVAFAQSVCMCSDNPNPIRLKVTPADFGFTGELLPGQCHFSTGIFNGAFGYLWINLEDVHVNGHSDMWADKNMFNESDVSNCFSTATTTKIVSQTCLDCICKQESGCDSIGCHYDVNSDSCGYYQIKEAYWKDCGSPGKPGKNWTECADDRDCADRCVENYMKRYAKHSNCPMTCEGFAREHNGGPRGCHHDSTLGYWHGVKKQPGCSDLV